jgi:indolepyruvate ferredoxin oxidoreductase alpha subunit
MLGIFPPLKTLDFVLDMGAGIGVAHGIKKSTKQKVIAFIGDSTFFHAGIPALTNMVFNESNALVVIMDNKITAMTGHQPHPGLKINIEKIVKALGVKNLSIVDPYNFNELKETIKKFLDSNELSVIIARRECIFLKIKKEGMKNQPKFEITDKCKNCKICLNLGCPAIEEDEQGKIRINPDLCFGCGLCSQICPVKAIKVIKPIKNKNKDEKI